MRQAGYLAAAGIYALDHNIDRLAEDHRKANEIAGVLEAHKLVKKVEPVETNIIIFEVNEDIVKAEHFIQKLLEKDIHIIGMGQGKLRMVTHLDYTDEMHGYLLEILKSI